MTDSSNSSDPNVRVSVVVPSHDHAPFIEQCLRSIFSQSRHPDELLVIDDGSSDESPKIIEKILSECPFPSELIVRPNKGLCATLNEAFGKTSGDYFAYLGSDDRWLPGFIATRVELLKSRPKAVLGYGHAYFLDGSNRIFDCTADWAASSYVDGDAGEMIYSGTAPMSSTVFYRRSALENHRWNEDSRLEDYEMYLRLSNDGEFAFDPRVLSIWRWHDYNAIHDLSFMLEETLGAQARCAPLIGWSPEELAKVQRRLRFRYVDEFVRTGKKSKAWRLYRDNLLGALSPDTFGRTTLRLLIPQSLIDWRRKTVWDRNISKYDEVEI